MAVGGFHSQVLDSKVAQLMHHPWEPSTAYTAKKCLLKLWEIDKMSLKSFRSSTDRQWVMLFVLVKNVLFLIPVFRLDYPKQDTLLS